MLFLLEIDFISNYFIKGQPYCTINIFFILYLIVILMGCLSYPEFRSPTEK